MKVKVVKRFHDMAQKKIQEKNTILDVSDARGKYLISQGMTEECAEPETAAEQQGKTEETAKESKGPKTGKAQKGQEE